MPNRADFHPLAVIAGAVISFSIGFVIFFFCFFTIIRLNLFNIFSPKAQDTFYIVLFLGSPIWIYLLGRWIIKKFSVIIRINRLIYKVFGLYGKGIITADPEKFGGAPYIRKTTVLVEDVIELLADGWPIQGIQNKYPGITEEQILACLNWRGNG